MQIFASNAFADIYRAQSFSLFGKAQVICVQSNVPCAILKLNDVDRLTPTKQEQSASHGRADVDQGTGQVQFQATTVIKNDDIIVIEGAPFRVSSTLLVRDLFMVPNHLEVSLRRINTLPSGTLASVAVNGVPPPVQV